MFKINTVLLNFFLITVSWKKINNIDHTIDLFITENQHIRMISEGSCDTEAWSDDAENSGFIKGINYI